MKTKKMLQKIVALAAAVTLLGSVFTGTLWASAEDTVIQALYDEGLGSGAWINFSDASGARVSKVEDTNQSNAAVGSGLLRVKLAGNGTAAGQYEWLDIRFSPKSENLKDTAALQFYYNPLIASVPAEVGVAYESSGEYPSVRINVEDFLAAQEISYEVGDFKWVKVTIPFSYLAEYGTYYDGADRAQTMPADTFNWSRIGAFTIGAVTKGLTDQVSWCRLDGADIIAYDGSLDLKPLYPEPDPDTATPEAKGQVIKQLYDKTGPVAGISQGRFGDPAFSVGTDNLGTHFQTGQAPGADPEITKIARLKVGSQRPEDKTKTGMAAGEKLYFSWYNPGKSLDATRDWVNTAAVEFWINPMTNKPDGLYAGVCSTEGSKIPNVVVDLHDVISLTDADYGDWKWQKVVLPLSYLKDNGTYCEAGSDLSEFNWANVSGMTILAVASDDAHAISSEINWIRMADAKLVTYLVPPTNLTAAPGDGSVALSWTASSGNATGYNIFRDGAYLGTVNTTSFTDSAATNNVTYTYQVQAISRDTASASVSVQATPTNGQAVIEPTVSITAPEAAAKYKVGDTVTITADAADSDGTIAKVEFMVDGAIVNTDAQAPYSYDWTATAGAHSITAKAWDNVNATTVSQEVSITVHTPPTVKMLYPLDGTKFVNGKFRLNAETAADTSINANNQVGNPIFYRKVGNGEARSTTAGQSVGAGTYTYYAEVTDSDGFTSTSAPVTVTVGEDGEVIRDFYVAGRRNNIGRIGANFTYRDGEPNGNGRPNPAGQGTTPIQVESKVTNQPILMEINDAANLMQNTNFKDTGAVNFSIWMDTEADQTYLDSWYISLVSHAASGSTTISSRLPLKDYLGAAQPFKQWVAVSIPFAAFDNGIFYKNADTSASAEASEFNWEYLYGVGFTCTPSDASKIYYLNDISFRVADSGDTPDPKPDFELGSCVFSANTLADAIAAGSVTATVSFTNNTEAAMPISVALAVYDGDRLAGVQFASQTSAAPGANTLTTSAVSLTGLSAETASVKALVWKGLADLQPYGDQAFALTK